MMMRLGGLLAILAIGVLPTTAFAQGEVSVERGLQVSITGGCHDCHTEGYRESEGVIDPAKAMKGSSVGFRGPWGTTYPQNLRNTVRAFDEKTFVQYIKHGLRMRPPMPWYNLRAMDDSDVRSLYLYLSSLGDPGKDAPTYVFPTDEPKTPYVVFAPPTIPKE
jgi:mono/diheme cytochrome c family protein